jgi:phospholipid-transporting ATPase
MGLGNSNLHYYDERQFTATVAEKYREEKMVYPTNFIKTSRYNVVDFLPIALLLQFTRYANVYFLVSAILTSISEISPISPITSILPLVVVIGISMIREGMEDWYRH